MNNVEQSTRPSMSAYGTENRRTNKVSNALPDAGTKDSTRADRKGTITLHHAGAFDVVFSPDSQHVITSGIRCNAKIWNLRAPDSPVRELTGLSANTPPAFSPDGRFIASHMSNPHRRVAIWDKHEAWATKRVLQSDTYQYFKPGMWTSVVGQLATVWSSNATDTDDRVSVWDVGQTPATVKVTLPLPADETSIFTYVYASPNTPLLAAWDHDVTRVWDLRDVQRTSDLEGEMDSYHSSYSPDGWSLATGSRDGTVRLYNLRQYPYRCEVLGMHESDIDLLRFSRDGRLLATTSLDDREAMTDTIKLWNVWQDPATCLATLVAKDRAIFNLTFSPNGQFMVTTDFSRRLIAWDLRTLPHVETTVLHEDVSAVTAFSAKGSLASVSERGQVRLWNFTTLPPVLARTVEHGSAAWRAHFSPDEQFFATVHDNGAVHVEEVP